MTQKSVFLVLIFVVVFFSNSFCNAASVNVQINGNIIDFTDSNGEKVEAQTINNRTMVPLRKIFETLGCDVGWDGDTQVITATKGDTSLSMQIDNPEVSYKKGDLIKDIVLDQAPIIKNNRTLVPLRFVSESLDMEVGWDNNTQTAVIIDYQYFVDLLKKENSSLFNLLSDGNSKNFTFSYNYTDKADTNNNEDATLTIKSSGTGNTHTSTISINGNSALVSEIKNEEWNDISYISKFNENNYIINSSNFTFSSILNGKKNEDIVLESRKINCPNSLSFKDTIRTIFHINNQEITDETFSSYKSDFVKLLDLAKNVSTKEIMAEDFTFTNITLKDVFSTLFPNEALNGFVIFANMVFDYSIDVNDLLYDYPTSTYSLTVSDTSLKLKLNLANEYKEVVEYEFTLSN